MANLRRDGRAQLLLVGAIGLATLLVVLALVLHGAMYTDALAADDNTQFDERGVYAYEDAVDRGVTAIVHHSNAASNGSTSLADLETAATDAIEEWHLRSADLWATDGVWTAVSVDKVDGQTRIVHENGTFTDAANTSDWTVAENASAISELEFFVEASSLATGENESCPTCFQVTVIDETGTTRQLTVGTSNGTTTIIVDTPEETTTCDVQGAQIRIDVVEGAPCEAVGNLLIDPPDTLQFSNGRNATGQYNATVGGGLESPADFSTDGSPRAVPQLTSVRVATTYRSSTLTYQGERVVEIGDANE